MEDPFQGMKRSEFISFCKAAVKDTKSTEYTVLYRFLVKCFAFGDADCDGKVSFDEFNQIVEVAAFTVRRLGLTASSKSMYKTPAIRDEARRKMFDEVDLQKNGYIAMEDWIAYTTKQMARLLLFQQGSRIRGWIQQ